MQYAIEAAAAAVSPFVFSGLPPSLLLSPKRSLREMFGFGSPKASSEREQAAEGLR